MVFYVGYVVEHVGDESYVVTNGLELAVETVTTDIAQKIVQSQAKALNLIHHPDYGRHEPYHRFRATVQGEVYLKKKSPK